MTFTIGSGYTAPDPNQPFALGSGMGSFANMSGSGFNMSQSGSAGAPPPAAIPTSAAISGLGTTGTTPGGISVAPSAMPQSSYGIQLPGAVQNALGQAGAPGFVAQPGGGGLGGLIRNSDGTWNMQGLSTIAGGLQTLGSMWQTWQAGKAARDALDFQKDAFERNMANQEQTYNTNLEDRIEARHRMEGRPEGDTRRYLNENRL